MRLRRLIGWHPSVARRIKLHALLLLIGMASGAQAFQGQIVGVASVIDGDTIEIRGQRIRLHGIDAPESGQTCIRRSGQSWPCGQQAALALADKVGRATISCEGQGTDRYQRVIAVCSKGTEDLNRWMVAQGLAVAYRRFSHDYVDAEEGAHRAGRGMWSGTFEMPWDWRGGRPRG